jgi:hypothetical protein
VLLVTIASAPEALANMGQDRQERQARKTTCDANPRRDALWLYQTQRHAQDLHSCIVFALNASWLKQVQHGLMTKLDLC